MTRIALLWYNVLTMLQTVRITSKRQITIPSKIFSLLQLTKGDRLLVEIEDDKLVLQKSQALLDKLAGSLKKPKKYEHRSLNFIITDSKRSYFQKR